MSTDANPVAAGVQTAGASPSPAVPILTYHSLDDSGSVISVSPQVFRQQMRALAAWGFRGIPLADLLDAWAGKVSLPNRPVVLTFDDGFRSVLEHAVPALVDVGFRATIFAVAGYCGRANDWPSQPTGIPRRPLLSWSELRDLADAGFEIGAHGILHEPLSRIAPEAARTEIVGSKRMLEEALGRQIATFAYPYGLENRMVRDAVAACYRGACGVSMAMARPGDDRQRLPRIDTYYLRSMLLFRLFPTALGRSYLTLRSLGRWCRAVWRGPEITPGKHTELKTDSLAEQRNPAATLETDPSTRAPAPSVRMAPDAHTGRHHESAGRNEVPRGKLATIQHREKSSNHE